MAAKLPEGLPELLEDVQGQPNLVPDELTRHLMRKAGQDCKDDRLVRIVSLAAQRFIAEAIFDSLQLCKARLASGVKKQLKAAGYKDKERVLTTEDLTTALREFGVNVRKAPYVVEPTAGSASAAPKATQP